MMDGHRPRPKSLGGGDQPPTIKELTDEAMTYNYDPNIPLRIYTRTFQLIFKEAHIYWREGNLSQAYILMFRASDLMIKHLLKHPGANDPATKKIFKHAVGQTEQVLRDLESLKPQVQAARDEWERNPGPRKRRSGEGLPDSRPTKMRYSQRVVDPRKYHGGELDQVIRTASRMPDDKKSIEAPTPSRTEWDSASKQETEQADTRRMMEEARRQLDERDPKRFLTDNAGPQSFSPSYPSLHPSRPIQDGPTRRHDTSSSHRPHRTQPPALPPKHRQTPKCPVIPVDTQPDMQSRPSQDLFEAMAPSLPAKVPLAQPMKIQSQDWQPDGFADGMPARPPKLAAVETRPELDSRPVISEPKDVVFEPAGHLESGEVLRHMYIPTNLRERFLKIAHPNTVKGLELCGLLCGRLQSNALFMSELLIPNQLCTENTCETVNEEEIWEFCDRKDLIVMGWIHTHPTQTCFLSSRDLHTHAVYQVQLPESIAIVCAPSFDDYGIFRVTDPPGKNFILQCTRPGIFHPHDPYRDNELYKTALNPGGHVTETKLLKQFPITDMRKDISS